MTIKRMKRTKNQRGGQTPEERERIHKANGWPETYQQWLNSSTGKYWKERMNNYGDSSGLQEMEAYYNRRAGNPVKSTDIDESTYQPPQSELGKFIKDNHIIARLGGGLVAGATAILTGGIGSGIAGSATTYGLTQLGLGAHGTHNIRPMRQRKIQHGGNEVVQQQNAVFCSPNSNSYGGVKF